MSDTKADAAPPADDDGGDNGSTGDGPQGGSRAPKIEGEFDAKRAQALIDRLRRENSELRPLADAARKAQDADKTAGERVAEAERRAQEAEARSLRLEVAAEKGLTPAQAKRLQGSTREEMETDADELLEAFGSNKGTKGDEKPPAGKPRERLGASGARTDDEDVEETDPAKLADQVLLRRAF